MQSESLFQEWNISPARFFTLTGLLGLAWGAALWFLLPHDVKALALFFGGVVCLAASVADWRSGLLPDIFTLYGGGATLAACIVAGMAGHNFTTWPGEILPEGAAEPLLGAALGFAFMKGAQLMQRRKHKGEEQIGSGDAKLMLPLGAMVGPFGLLPLLLIGTVATMLAFALRRLNGKEHAQVNSLPFGPGLTAAGLVVTLWGLRFPVI